MKSLAQEVCDTLCETLHLCQLDVRSPRGYTLCGLHLSPNWGGHSFRTGWIWAARDQKNNDEYKTVYGNNRIPCRTCFRTGVP